MKKFLFHQLFCFFLFIGVLENESLQAQTRNSSSKPSSPSSLKTASKKSTSSSTISRSKNAKQKKTTKRSSSSSSTVYPLPSNKRPFVNPPASDLNTSESEDKILKATPACPDLDLPTDNHLMFSRTHSANFYQPTTSGRLISATFGCVRNPNFGGRFTRFHEGIDIRPLERDEEEEPLDRIIAMASGTLVYMNSDERNSNYGKYLVLQHELHRITFYSLYAHLADVEDDLKVGCFIQKGQKLGIMGRTSNEFEIDTNQAHLHFEIDMMVHDRFHEYSGSNADGSSKHGLYHGTNLIGIDPLRFFQFMQYNPDLNLGDFVLRETVAFKALIPYRKELSWTRRYPFTYVKNDIANPVALEVCMSYYGLPIKVIPKSKMQIKDSAWRLLSKGYYPLTYANASLLKKNLACGLVAENQGLWGLTRKGSEWLRLVSF